MQKAGKTEKIANSDLKNLSSQLFFHDFLRFRVYDATVSDAYHPDSPLHGDDSAQLQIQHMVT